jgi:hydroxymethylpyrimidine pyrophosphatase-like HAD family hydrolase
MKLGAIAIDYDGTVAIDGVFDPSVRLAIAELRLNGIAVILVTGRRLDDLRGVAGNLGCFNAIVAENGAVLYFPESGREAQIGHVPPPTFLDALSKRQIDVSVGNCVVEAHASKAPPILEVIRDQEQPLVLAFNRQRLMVLPLGVAKSTGLRRALSTLRLSIHNAIGIGDAENDHDLLDACEVGVAVEWGSRALRVVADEVIPGTGPSAVAGYLRSLIGQVRLSARQMGRRRLLLGHLHDGQPLHLAIRGRTVLVAGEPGSGKSWIAGLLCEQLILQGYCLCIIDPEGDYRSLEALPSVIVMGGDDPLPRARDLAQALRYPDASVVIDLSRTPHAEKREYLHELLPILASLRRETGLPHKIVLDEAHYYLAEPEGRRLIDAELAGYILVTYRVSGIDPQVRSTTDEVVIVTRETDPQEQETLRAICAAAGRDVPKEMFRDLLSGEASLLPGIEESRGGVQRFQLAPRITSHVRHRQKYLDMPVSESHAFVFMVNGQPGSRARSLKDLVVLLTALPETQLAPHLERHDISRWIEQVFRDCPLATHVRGIETRADGEGVRDVASDISQAVRARYDLKMTVTTGMER